MCGIAGFVDRSEEVPDIQVLEAMADSIAHRGPDDHGYYQARGVGLAHRRLSIIDLSANGHQPMPNADASNWIVFNGEIYNYLELGRELAASGHTFRSSSDTEVLLHGYEEHGPAWLGRLNGMFAFAVWDERRRRLFAARDRIGIKPFYYFFDGATFVFGSEIKALLRHPAVRVEPDWEAIREYLMFGHAVGDRTWYRGIRQLAPGCYLLLEDGKLRQERYWELRLEPEYNRSLVSCVEELRALLDDAVRLHWRSDVPVGAYLSGGIDSSSIVALAAKQRGERMHTFSAAFREGPQYDERPYIEIVARTFKTVHHEVIPSADSLPGLLPTLLWHLDQPVVGPAVLPMYHLSRLVAESGVKVVNGGQGGDELFGGYPSFYVPAAKNLIRGLRHRSENMPWRELARVPQYLWMGGAGERLLQRFRQASNVTPAWLRTNGSVRSDLKEQWRSACDSSLPAGSFEEMTYMNLKHWLPGLLHQEDRISMAWSTESRVPILDYRLIELAGKMPSWAKVRGGTLKYVLRAAMRGCVPDEILDRTDKMGFPTPVSQWFRGPLRSYVERTLSGRKLSSEPLVNRAAVEQMVRDHTSGAKDYGAVLWKILNTEIWLREVEQGWIGLRQ
jgi:asparagine synthase (glutamine-hydrolysing)